MKKPNAVAASSYVVNYDESECIGCFLCTEDRCPVSAVQEAVDVVAVDSSRCIGCGLCVSVCPTEALTMKKRDQIPNPPVVTPGRSFCNIRKNTWGRFETTEKVPFLSRLGVCLNPIISVNQQPTV